MELNRQNVAEIFDETNRERRSITHVEKRFLRYIKPFCTICEYDGRTDDGVAESCCAVDNTIRRVLEIRGLNVELRGMGADAGSAGEPR